VVALQRTALSTLHSTLGTWGMDSDEASGTPRAPRWIQGLEYVSFFLIIAYNLLHVDYSGTPVVAVACVSLLTVCWLGQRKHGPGLWSLGANLSAPVVPYIHCAGAFFCLVLLLHTIVMPSAAPGIYAIVVKNQLTLIITWFILGFLAGSEAGSIRVKVGLLVCGLLFIDMRTRIIHGLLSQPESAPAQETATCQSPTMHELAMRSQMAPAMIGNVVGTVLRAKWQRVLEAAVTEKELLTQALSALSTELQWLRSHNTELETARRDALLTKTRRDSKQTRSTPSDAPSLRQRVSQRCAELCRKASSEAGSEASEVAAVVSSEAAPSRTANRSPARSRRPHGLSPVRE